MNRFEHYSPKSQPTAAGRKTMDMRNRHMFKKPNIELPENLAGPKIRMGSSKAKRSKKDKASPVKKSPINYKKILSDRSSSPNSNLSDEIYWSDFLNLTFATKIFSKDSEYIYELGNIYAAQKLIDEAMSNIIPNIQVYKRLAGHI